MSALQNNLQAIKERIHQAALACGRSAQEIKLLAVSKTFPAEDVRDAFSLGQTCFGENYVQEGVAKVLELKDLRSSIEWHFIGPIQSNKSKDVAENFDWVHSIDRIKIAQRLNDQRPPHLPSLEVCVQVNISGEASKSGIHPDELLDICEKISSMPHLHLRGLMSIPEPTEDMQAQRMSHQQLRELLKKLQQSTALDHQKIQLDTLSMGMSSDIEAAIAEGSTMVRVGTAIFGKRTYL
jgi:pyridoxal phosphate enzyme (YggS family)